MNVKVVLLPEGEDPDSFAKKQNAESFHRYIGENESDFIRFKTELLLQQAMVSLREGRTSFVIAHRLSTIRDANVIVVMEDGRIVEKGNHAELLEAKGAYYDLYQSQFQAAIS